MTEWKGAILVTGASGSIGAAAVRKLVAEAPRSSSRVATPAGSRGW